MLSADLVLKNCSELLTVGGASDRPKTRAGLGDLGIIKDGAVAIAGGRIVWVGESRGLGMNVSVGKGTAVVDAGGKVVMPGFVDCHTHLVFAGSREQEWLDRLGGKEYLEILMGGGGILDTVKATRRARDEELVENGLRILGRMLAEGTTTVEAKSGYGLTLRDEIRILKVIRKLGRMQPVDIVPTFLGAHAVPQEFANSKAYARYVAEKMIPEVARLKLAEYCDVFCEKGAFSAGESRSILYAGSKCGMMPKIHTDEFYDTGGTVVARDARVVSADHLDAVSGRGIANIKEAGSIAVLLPGVQFFLGRDSYPNAQRLIAAGVPVAIATDFNPGSCFCHSIPFIMSLACIKMKLSPEQAISAVTINAAHAIGRAGSVGSIEVGKQADLLLLGVKDHRQLPYHLAANPVEMVVKRGRVCGQARP